MVEDERKSEGREEGKKERGFCCRSREDVGEGIFITVICASSASERAPSARSSSRAGKERKKGKEEGESENGVRPKWEIITPWPEGQWKLYCLKDTLFRLRAALSRLRDAVDRRSRRPEGGIMQPEGGILWPEGSIISNWPEGRVL